MLIVLSPFNNLRESPPVSNVAIDPKVYPTLSIGLHLYGHSSRDLGWVCLPNDMLRDFASSLSGCIIHCLSVVFYITKIYYQALHPVLFDEHLNLRRCLPNDMLELGGALREVALRI
jgi:hypothetical protein